MPPPEAGVCEGQIWSKLCKPWTCTAACWGQCPHFELDSLGHQLPVLTSTTQPPVTGNLASVNWVHLNQDLFNMMPVMPGMTWSCSFRTLLPVTRVKCQGTTKWSCLGALCAPQLWKTIPHILPMLTVGLVQSFLCLMRNKRVSKAYWSHSTSSLNLVGLLSYRWTSLQWSSSFIFTGGHFK